MEPFRLTASQALRQFKDGSLTIEAHARSLLSRIQERDPVVKAWSHINPGYVLAQAKRLDRVPLKQRGPLHGVAVAVKDVIHTRDMRTQHGSPIYKRHAPKVDAGVVATLRHAGALLLGKTHTTEFASMSVGPPTCNPHDPKRTPGGSSSGSGAAVGDFQAPIGLGTQTAGSAIRPGSYNGIYAFKPTWNAVGREGLKIHSLIFDTLGLFTRSVDDLELLADIFGLHDDQPPAPELSTVRGAKFALLRTPQWDLAGPGTIAAMEKARQLLRNHGAEVEEIELPEEFNRMNGWHMTVMCTDGQPAFLPEYRTHKDKLCDYIVDMVENKRKISHAQQLEAFDGMAALRPKMDALAKTYAAIIAPSVADEAPVGQKSTGNAAFNAIWTGLHTPVVNVPGFQGENGLPIGLSLVGARYHDRRLLVVAKGVGGIFEAEGGWKSKL